MARLAAQEGIAALLQLRPLFLPQFLSTEQLHIADAVRAALSERHDVIDLAAGRRVGEALRLKEVPALRRAARRSCGQSGWSSVAMVLARAVVGVAAGSVEAARMGEGKGREKNKGENEDSPVICSRRRAAPESSDGKPAAERAIGTEGPGSVPFW